MKMSLKFHIFFVVAFSLSLLAIYQSIKPIDQHTNDLVAIELSHIHEADNRLLSHVFALRTGVLVNHDMIIDDYHLIREREAVLRGLLQKVDRQNIALPELDKYLAVFDETRQKIDRFRATNSVLRNSLTYFPRLTQENIDQLAANTQTRTLALTLELEKGLEDLFRKVFYYYSNGGLENHQAAIDCLNILQNRVSDFPEDIKVNLQTNLRHAEIILTTIPQIDAFLAELMADPLSEQARKVDSTYDKIQAHNQEQQQRLQWLMMLAVASLIAYLSYILYCLFDLYRTLDLRVKSRTHDLEESNKHLHQEIVQHKETQEYLESAKMEAEAASRTKSAFLANMSHELRTPLNAIIGFSDILSLQAQNPDPAQVKEFTGHIQKSGQHLLSIITDILDMSKIDADKLTLTETVFILNSEIDACLSMLATQINEAKLTTHNKLGDMMIHIKGDQRLLKQCLINLLSNAVKFTPEQGIITIGYQILEEDRLAITVQDTGIGMDEEGIKIALTPFGQVDSELNRKYEGTGLGLPLVEKFITLHDGELLIESALDQGTTMSLILPKSRYELQEMPQSSSVAVNN